MGSEPLREHQTPRQAAGLIDATDPLARRTVTGHHPADRWTARSAARTSPACPVAASSRALEWASALILGLAGCQMETGSGSPRRELAAIAGLAAPTPARATAPAASSQERAALSPRPPQEPLSAADASASPLEAAERPDCGPEMVRLGRYCIDRYEAHLVELSAGGGERIHPHTERPEKGARYTARALASVFPQGYVNRHEAAAACALAGKRLCSVVEWFEACSNGRSTTFPYGDGRLREACNNGKLHLLTRLFGRDARNWQYGAHFNSPALNGMPGYLARAGEYSQCVTTTGVYDLVGNLHEWVSDTVDDDLPSKVPLLEDIRRSIPRNRGHGIFVGGFYSTTAEHGEGCHYLTPGHEPTYHDYSTGFRCCKDAVAAPDR